MKQWVSYGLIICIGIYASSRIVGLITWKFHQETITKTMCVNKNNLKLKCNGKCQLMKMMDEEPGNQSSSLPSPSQKTSFELHPFWIKNDRTFLNFNFSSDKVTRIFENIVFYKSSGFDLRLIKPPEYILSA